ncbi:hypothetical protein L3i22_068360 [Actinoplanes sp. L3-i22]|nr:hypothetical protein L3i22_068360 [Actinoplanes sp. L3-i22]
MERERRYPSDPTEERWDLDGPMRAGLRPARSGRDATPRGAGTSVQSTPFYLFVKLHCGGQK